MYLQNQEIEHFKTLEAIHIPPHHCSLSFPKVAINTTSMLITFLLFLMYT
jgi:hypothetical protein